MDNKYFRKKKMISDKYLFICLNQFINEAKQYLDYNIFNI